MPQYLSPEWFGAMQSAASAYVPDEQIPGKVSLRETVTETPFGEVSWVLTIEDGKITFAGDSTEDADVNFRQDYQTAVALHRGEMTTQQAFFEGRVRVSGHLNTLLEQVDLLSGVAPIFDQVRSSTTY